MAKVLCITCSLEFPSEQVYKQHKQDVHAGKIPGGSAVQGLPPGVTEDMLPSPDFIEKVQRIENPVITKGNMEVHQVALPQLTNAASQQIGLQPKEPQPLELTYVWKGDCPTHGTPVETLLVNVANATYALARCSAENNVIEQRKVANLTQHSYLHRKSLKSPRNASKGVSMKGDEK